MAISDLVPWANRPRDVSSRRAEENTPFLKLHREMNRLFDDVFRGFDLGRLGDSRFLDRATPWPNIEFSETEKEMKVVAELPGLDEKDVEVELVNGTLAIRGEKKTETEGNNPLFSERYYGRFERRISVDDVEPDRVTASFKSGVLTVTLPKSPAAQQKVKRIAINSR